MDQGEALTLAQATPIDERVRALLRAHDLAGPDAEPRATPLAGGVSCDVWKVDTDRGSYAVKRALPQLRVKSEWLAPVERAATEVRWLRRVARIAPAQVPEVVAEDQADHLFAMRFLAPEAHPVWKDELAAGRVVPEFAGAVGAALAAIHAATARDADTACDFDTMAQFDALRIDPFLRHTAKAHPDRADRLLALAADLADRRVALVHGDASPKNILMGPAGPVFLDAECAVHGDPVFDPAFVLTHLLLKTVWVPSAAERLMDSARALVDSYREGVDWESAEAIDRRIAALASALLLARVDGKSPAPYLDEAGRALVRRRARALLAVKDLDLAGLLTKSLLETDAA